MLYSKALLDVAYSCRIVLFGKYKVSAVIADDSFTSIARDLDVYEVFSGHTQSLHQAATSLGKASRCYDKVLGHPSCVTEEGFLHILRTIFQLRVGGLLPLEPECSTFVFAPMVHTKRKACNLSGDTSNPWVADGNTMAQMVVFFLCIALLRGLHSFIEQPASSMMFSYLQPFLDPLFKAEGKLLKKTCTSL